MNRSSRDHAHTHNAAPLASELAGQQRSVSGAGRLPTPRFGDIVENAWASIDNPTRVGLFVREIRRTGRLNRGRFFEVTDGHGRFWQVMADRDHRTTVRPRDIKLTMEEYSQHLAHIVMALEALERLIDKADRFEAHPEESTPHNQLLAELNNAREIVDIIANDRPVSGLPNGIGEEFEHHPKVGLMLKINN